MTASMPKKAKLARSKSNPQHVDQKLSVVAPTAPVAVRPHQCACSQVKEGRVPQCPVHWLQDMLPQSYH
jgi:hypothetical protein